MLYKCMYIYIFMGEAERSSCWWRVNNAVWFSGINHPGLLRSHFWPTSPASILWPIYQEFMEREPQSSQICKGCFSAVWLLSDIGSIDGQHCQFFHFTSKVYCVHQYAINRLWYNRPCDTTDKIIYLSTVQCDNDIVFHKICIHP